MACYVPFFITWIQALSQLSKSQCKEFMNKTGHKTAAILWLLETLLFCAHNGHKKFLQLKAECFILLEFLLLLLECLCGIVRFLFGGRKKQGIIDSAKTVFFVVLTA